MKNTITKFIFTLIGLLFFSGNAFSAGTKIGDLYYNIDSSSKTAEVTYSSDSPYNTSNYVGLTVATIPTTVEYNGTIYSVTSIGREAFSYCSGLTSVTIPNSVTSIGMEAFLYCSGLTRVDIADLESWCRIEFSGDGSNPLVYTHHLYLNDQEVKDLVIPNSITSIGNYTFYGCSGLTSVTIPNSVTSIGGSAFGYCSGLTSVTIPNSVTSIENYTFYGCRGLTSVTIPNSVTSIGMDAFVYCSGLTRVDIADLESWCRIEFSGDCSNPLLYAHHLYLNDQEVKDLVIPNSVPSIGNYAFSGCSGLTSVTIPNSVTSIGDYAFYDCSGLTNIEIPNSVTSIGDYAFSGCSRLTNIMVRSLVPPKAERYTFDTDTYISGFLYVPEESINSYKEIVPWSYFFTIKPNYDAGVEEIGAEGLYDVFNLNGQLMMRQASREDINDLEPGIYIINGKKMMVKQW